MTAITHTSELSSYLCFYYYYYYNFSFYCRERVAETADGFTSQQYVRENILQLRERDDCFFTNLEYSKVRMKINRVLPP